MDGMRLQSRGNHCIVPRDEQKLHGGSVDHGLPHHQELLARNIKYEHYRRWILMDTAFQSKSHAWFPMGQNQRCLCFRSCWPFGSKQSIWDVCPPRVQHVQLLPNHTDAASMQPCFFFSNLKKTVHYMLRGECQREGWE